MPSECDGELVGLDPRDAFVAPPVHRPLVDTRNDREEHRGARDGDHRHERILERVAKVDEVGLVSVSNLGETAIVARYEGNFAVANLIVLPPDKGFQPTPVPGDNLVDRHIISKLNDLRIKPSEIADDEHFLRRLTVDLTGIQPTPEQVLAFATDQDPAKREKIIASTMRLR